MAQDWQSELVKLNSEKGKLSQSLIISLIDSMYLTHRIVQNLNEIGYDLELGLINKSNLPTQE